MSGGTLTDTRVEEGGEIDTRHFPGKEDQRRRRTCGNDSDTIRNKEEEETLFFRFSLSSSLSPHSALRCRLVVDKKVKSSALQQ